MPQSLSKYRILNILVMIYLIAAFSWWAILLFKKNETNFQLKKQLSQYDSTYVEGDIIKDYERQKFMVLGEGIVFGLSIFFGLILINRAFWSEISLNQRLNDFLLSVTHELKTPIATLKMANETLMKENLSPQQRTRLLKTGKEETNRLEAQVNNILAAAQIEKSYKYNFEKFDFLKLLQSRIRRFEKLDPSRQLNLSTNSEDCILNADKESIVRVIDNLLSNALKYSPANTVVEIETHQTKNKLTLSVKDFGEGIKQNQKNKIWNKFYRIENEETRETQGTGLGLWIVKEIITRHKGQISVNENNPHGSIFKVELPL